MNKNLPNKLIKLEDFASIPPPNVSFEFFPPKTEESENNLWRTIKELEPLNPKFVSVTYGAGGSTRERTHNTVKRIKDETNLKPAAHLTCIKATKNEIKDIANRYLEAGINHIVALRGDPPEGINSYKAPKDSYQNATELVKGLKDIGDFEISVAAFPEGHPETGNNIDRDLDYLKAKEDAGATRAISQYFLAPNMYLEFINKVEQKGIKIPVVPGIIVISNFTQFVKFSNMCGSTIPKWVKGLLDGLDDTPQTRDMVAVNISAEISRELVQNGVDHLHFYTLNRAHQTRAICRLLGVKES